METATAATEPMETQTLEVLSYGTLVLTEQKVTNIWKKSIEFPLVFDDITYGDFDHFMQTLLNPRNVFFEVGEENGLVCFTNVRPSIDASLHFVFYDKKLRGKEPTMHAILRDVFKMCGLRRMSCFVPVDRETGVNFIRRLGFKREGLMRQTFLRGGNYIDVGIYGMLAEELPMTAVEVQV